MTAKYKTVDRLESKENAEKIKILLKDCGVVAAIKPAGVLSEDDGEGSMPALLRERMALDGEMSEVFTVHRLDRGVGGVMVYALSSFAAAELSRQISGGTFKKEYFAVVKGMPEEKSGVLQDLLFFDRTKNKSFVVDRQRKGVRDASLEYRTVASADGLSLLHIRLHTGRTHQIRVQFSSRGMPLWGDSRYGGGRDGNIALWSARIVFRIPGSGKPCEVRAAFPDEYPWTLFGPNEDYLNYFPEDGRYEKSK